MTATFNDFVREQLSVVGPVQVRRMFGGAGVFLDGRMFALIAFDTLYLKADETTKPAFEAEGLEPFVYEAKGGKRAIMSYWQAPERIFDDPDEMRSWAGLAVEAARRAAAKKPVKKPGKKPARKKTMAARKTKKA